MQASEIKFFRRMKGVTLFNKMLNSEIQKPLKIEPLLFRMERSQLIWVGNISRMFLEKLHEQALLAKANGKRPVGRLKIKWTNYIEDLGCRACKRGVQGVHCILARACRWARAQGARKSSGFRVKFWYGTITL